MTLREIAVYHVLSNIGLMVSNYYSVLLTEQIESQTSLPEYLAAYTADVETWLQAEQKYMTAQLAQSAAAASSAGAAGIPAPGPAE